MVAVNGSVYIYAAEVNFNSQLVQKCSTSFYKNPWKKKIKPTTTPLLLSNQEVGLNNMQFFVCVCISNELTLPEYKQNV